MVTSRLSSALVILKSVYLVLNSIGYYWSRLPDSLLGVAWDAVRFCSFAPLIFFGVAIFMIFLQYVDFLDFVNLQASIVLVLLFVIISAFESFLQDPDGIRESVDISSGRFPTSGPQAGFAEQNRVETDLKKSGIVPGSSEATRLHS